VDVQGEEKQKLINIGNQWGFTNSSETTIITTQFGNSIIAQNVVFRTIPGLRQGFGLLPHLYY
jgi:hypothetical protein